MFEKFIDKCKSCLAPILWTQTEKGRMMPVDAEPATGGNIQLMDRGDELPLAQYHTVKAPGIRYHKSHLATCPHAHQHRKKTEPDEYYGPPKRIEEEEDDSGPAGIGLMDELPSMPSISDPAPVESSFESGGGESGGAGAGSSWDDSSSSDSSSGSDWSPSDSGSSDSGSSDSSSSDMAGDSGSSGDSTC